MIKVENINISNFDGAIRGMRNPMNSWTKSDSEYCNMEVDCSKCEYDDSRCPCYEIGSNDLDLMQRLYKAGPEHAKYLRQIFVCMDIVAPLYWWKEFDTYKVGTTSNSCSTMHKIHSKEFTIEDFSTEHLIDGSVDTLNDIIEWLNWNRDLYNKEQNKRWWWQMIQLLPSSYNQRRTITMSYANVMNIINQRSTHKLDEWIEMCDILKHLPYVKAIRGEE